MGGITGPSVRAILYSLTGEMKEKYLLPSVRGEKKACFAQTEPDAGSDPGGMRTVAVRDGDHYVINGVKRFITGAGEADFMQLMAATDRAKGSHGGISCFIVDMDTPGVKLTTQYKTMMGDQPWEIVLDNVRVPVSHRVGEEGDGFRHAQQWLGAGRVRHGARALGVTERCLELAASYAKQRSTFGRPLADRQSIQWMLADMYVELEAARLLVYKAATRLDKGEDARNDAYVCKYFADEMAFKAADMCMQIHGGIALTTDLPIEKFWRQQRSFRITEGRHRGDEDGDRPACVEDVRVACFPDAALRPGNIFEFIYCSNTRSRSTAASAGNSHRTAAAGSPGRRCACSRSAPRCDGQ